MRAGLVSFGQALFYCIGGYTAGVLAANYKISEALIVVPLAGFLAGVDGLSARLPDAALSRHLLCHAEPCFLDDPVRRCW